MTTPTSQKQFATTQAQFALAGHSLERTTRADDGHVTYTVGRWGQTRTFSHWHDVISFSVQIGVAQ